MTKALYNIKSSNRGYEIAKFDLDLNVEATYSVSLGECDCPAGEKHTCRHRKMLPMFLELDRVDSPYFLDFDTKTWHKPLEDGESATIEYHSDLVRRRAAKHQGDGYTQGLEVIPDPRLKEEATKPRTVSAPTAQSLAATEGVGSKRVPLEEPKGVEVSVTPNPPSVAPLSLKRRRIV